MIKGIPSEIKEEEVAADLDSQNYHAIKVTRMNNRRGKANMMLVEIAKDYKSIYDIKTCCYLTVEIEPLRKRTTIVQCHRCQLFGHIQRNCNADYRCMKCGRGHSTHTCENPTTTPARCANCEEDHLSTSLKCTDTQKVKAKHDKKKQYKDSLLELQRNN